MKKRWLSIALAVCLIVGMLSVPALAGEAHNHDDWTAITMSEFGDMICFDGTEAGVNTLPGGNYYLNGEITVPLTISGEVNLCLNGQSITVSSGRAITVNPMSSLTLSDCVGEGKVIYTGDSSSNYSIYNSGKLVLNSGAVESTYRGVYNGSSASLTLKGGSVSGGTYGIYNISSTSKVYLSGSPSVTGGTAGIYTNSSFSNISANDGAETPTAYSGSPITLAYASMVDGHTAVRNVTDETKDKFTLADENYGLAYDGTMLLRIEGKATTLRWYDENDNPLSGENYPVSVPYGADLTMPEPTKEGKIFFGWLYRSGGAAGWSSSYWSGGAVTGAMEFKADYMDSFAGAGTAEAPFEIATAADLQKLATVVNRGLTAFNNSGVYYRLTADVDLSSVCGADVGSWTPIGNSGNSFQSNFDGNGKTISNLYIDTSSSDQGLFGSLDGATVKNLTITGTVSAGGSSGALAGKISDSTVEHVDVSGVTTAPYGYTADGTSTMAYKVKGNNTVDVKGNYRGSWIRTTCNDAGYEVETEGLDGATVAVSPEFVNGGKYVRLSYTVTAGEGAIEDGKLAVHSNIQIGDNGNADIEAIQDSDGKVIGLKMVDTDSGSSSCNAQLNVYFDGTGGVTPVDTCWFGYYSDRSEHYFDNLTDETKSTSGSADYTKDENGVFTKLSSISSGFAVSWQNIRLQPNESRTYSFILGVGEKADPPVWSSDDTIPVCLTLAADSSAEENRLLIDVSAKVTDAAGQTDTLYYSVNGGAGVELGHVEADGTVKTITGQIDLRSYENGKYDLTFWMVNTAGAASPSVTKTVVIERGKITEGLDTEAPSTYTVTFDVGGHGTAPAAITDVTSGSTITAPTAPSADGWIFEGWYKEAACTSAWNFDGDTVTDNITLYAKWTANTPAPTPTPGGGKYTFTMPAGMATVSAALFKLSSYDCRKDRTCPIWPFTDSSATAWYHDGVHFCLANDLMGGYGNRKFGPDDTLTRAMLVQIFYSMDARPAAAGGHVFNDVADNAWYVDAALWAADSGIVNGYPDGTFAPGEPITREQLAVALYRYARCKGMAAVTPTESLRQFADADKISGYALQAMHWAVKTGVLGGYGDKTLRPRSGATRAEAAQMIMNFFENVDK